jgi:hydroxyethylthiazole kinase-like uncharacterized protein yjeF
MHKVLTAAEMREVDRQTTEKYAIPSLLLMENAAQAVARVITEKLGGSVKDRSFLILCGKGNNGGDGAALARILWTQGADVEVCLFGLVEHAKGDARVNFEILQKISDNEGLELDQADLAFEEITGLEEWLEYDSVNFTGDDPDVIVDALFGTGLDRPLEGVYEQVAAFMFAFNDEEDGPLVVSLDVPSGLIADEAEVAGSTPCSNLTVTFTAPKLANVLPPASNYNGELHIANIGSPCELTQASASQTFLAEESDVRRWLEHTEFSPSSYKNKRGHALLIAGSKNYSGAAVMCGNAAIRSGVGLVTIATPEAARDSIAARVEPEVMTRSMAECEDGKISETAFEDISEFWKKIDSVSIGSGIGVGNGSTKSFLDHVIRERRTPLIIDADALTMLSPFSISGNDELPLILTPHDAELLRLLGTEDRDILKDRVSVCRRFATEHKVILVMKGQRTMIAAPDGRVVINPTGNSGLGKAGNGDTLAGLIAGFVAQAVQCKVDIFDTVVAAVYFAGTAGDVAEMKYGKRVMTASDVRESFAETFAMLADTE